MNDVCNEVDANKVQRWGKGFRAPRQAGEEEEAQSRNLPPSAPQFLDQSCRELPTNGGSFGIRTVCLILPSLTKEKPVY